jgi:hypothetical protein
MEEQVMPEESGIAAFNPHFNGCSFRLRDAEVAGQLPAPKKMPQNSGTLER